MLRACLNSYALSGDDANGGANGGGGASALRSSSSSLPGWPWRQRDWPTTAPEPAVPERQGPVPHQLQRVPELSSSSLISPFSGRMPCQRQAADLISRSPQRRSRGWEVATSIQGDYLRQRHQCTPRDRVPSPAQEIPLLLKNPAARRFVSCIEQRRTRDGLSSAMAAALHGRSAAFAGFGVYSHSTCFSRPRRSVRHGGPRNAACDGHHRLWRLRRDIGRRVDRVAQAKILKSVQPRRQTQLMCGTITVPLGRYSCT